MPDITTFLWFDDQAEQAAQQYTSIFPNSEITGVTRYGSAGPGPEGSAMTVTFTLDGKPFIALNGGPQFSFTEAVSLMVHCKDGDEVDHYWSALTAGGEESMCGWLKDRYGLSWQIVPDGVIDVISDPDPGRSQRAVKAMMGMRKLDLDALTAAADAAT